MKYLKKFNSIEEYEVYINGLGVSYPNVSYILEDKKVMYTAAPKPLYVEAIEDLTVKFSTNTIQYSLDGVTWNDLPAATATPIISKGSKVYFKATGLTPANTAGIGTFSMTGKCNVGGNIMSMIYGDDYNGQAQISAVPQFYYLFKDCVNVVDASKLQLPATTLSTRCYSYMFYGCTSLTAAPALPATTLTDSCYSSMFRDCTSLVNAPALPATTLKDSCYSGMFNGCTSLVNAPVLPATILKGKCYNYMFKGCSNLNYVKAMFKTPPSSDYTSNWLSGVAATGTFVKNAAATWSVTGVNGIPEGWTVETAEA